MPEQRNDEIDDPTPHRFKVNWGKCLEGIHLLAQRQPGITMFYVAKVFYFADKAHLLDWGRPISGDRYVAMENGPVPSAIYDLVKESGYLADDLLDEFGARIEKRGRHLFARQPFVDRALSKTDVEYLESALRQYGHMSFGALSDLTHRERAWREAWGKPGFANEMDPFLLIDEGNADRGRLIEEIRQKTAYAA
ncbi:MAG TPA: Panacea domain-containing protein [Hyphomicrobiaceae bacterium]|jgi:uncharacterized phage-associated protein